MDREGFKNRMSLYKEARAIQPQLSYWEWRQKYDAAPKPDAMPDQPQADAPTQQVEPAADRAHRWDNEHYVDDNVILADADRHRTWKEPKQITIKRKPGTKPRFPRHYFMKLDDIKHMKFLQTLGTMGKVLRGASMASEVFQQLFPSEEAELIEDMRAKMDKQNKWLTGQEPLPVYAQGGVIENGEDDEKTAIPTQEEYIAQQIAAKKAAALEKSLTRTMPRIPKICIGQHWNPYTQKVEPTYMEGSTCAYTFSDNYGQNWMGSEDFRYNHKKYGWRQIPWESRQPGDAVLIIGDDNVAKHTMMYDSDNEYGQPLFNHSNGGGDESAIRKKAKYPHHNPYLTYEFVGTPADSTQWINDYKKLYGYDEGGEIKSKSADIKLDPMEVLKRSRPNVSGIPIDDKPLSGTDPIGELYLNFVSGNNAVKVLKALKTGLGRKRLKNAYDYYHNELRFPRKMAYDVSKTQPYMVEDMKGLVDKFINFLKWI